MLQTNSLLKVTGGLPGDYLESTVEGCFINGHYRGAVKDVDSRGKPLPRFVYRGIIPAGSLFVLGQTDNSYDSRYFGFVAVAGVVAYKPLFF